MTAYYAPISPFRAGLMCRCPRCGEGRLFTGLLTVLPTCAACGLDYTKVDTGDGPAVFIILILGFIIVGAALWVEMVFSPPEWVHLVLWLPATIIGAIALLRPFKATLIALQFRYRAHQSELI